VRVVDVPTEVAFCCMAGWTVGTFEGLGVAFGMVTYSC
jgi:hypothetical protein